MANDGPNELFNNNLDGTFRPLAKEQGIAGKAQTREVIATDFDNDRDVDLVVINRQPPHEVYQNNRLWKYEPASGFDQLIKTPLLACLAVDQNADGRIEFLTLSESGLAVWRATDKAEWQPALLGQCTFRFTCSDGRHRRQRRWPNRFDRFDCGCLARPAIGRNDRAGSASKLGTMASGEPRASQRPIHHRGQQQCYAKRLATRARSDCRL